MESSQIQLESSLIELESSLIQLKNAANELVRCLIRIMDLQFNYRALYRKSGYFCVSLFLRI